THNGLRLKRFIVEAPLGSKVSVRCHGRRCPFRRDSRTAGAGQKGKGPTTRIRIKRLERKLLSAGLVIRVFVTKPGVIGKYTRFKVRGGKPPARSDRCLMPGTTRPTRCPS